MSADLTRSPAWLALKQHAAQVGSRHLRELFAADPQRGERLVIEDVGLYFDYAKQRVNADTMDLLSGRLDGSGAPEWIGVVLAVLALLALVPRVTRIPVLVCWIVALVTAVVAALLGRMSFSLAATTTPAGLGVLVTVLQGCFLVAAVLGAAGFAVDLSPKGEVSLSDFGTPYLSLWGRGRPAGPGEGTFPISRQRAVECRRRGGGCPR